MAPAFVLPKVWPALRLTEITSPFTVSRSSRVRAVAPSIPDLADRQGHYPKDHAQGGEEASFEAAFRQEAPAQDRADEEPISRAGATRLIGAKTSAVRTRLPCAGGEGPRIGRQA